MASERAYDGGHAAFIVQARGDVDRLLESAATRWRSVTVIAIPAWDLLACAFAPLSGGTTAVRVRQSALDEAALVAREAACALPSDVDARHLVYESWWARSFLASLREGKFDVALLAAGPPWIHRNVVLRAARAGGTAVVRVPVGRRLVVGLASLLRR